MLWNRGLVTFAAILFPYLVASTALLLKEQTSLPSGWSLSPTPPSQNQTITLNIGLAQQDFPGLEKSLYAVSEPSSPSYGVHLSRDAVLAYLEPTDATTTAVRTWLASHGFRNGTFNVSAAKDWYTITTTVGMAQTLLNCTFRTYILDEGTVTLVRTTAYWIPSDLDSHIDTIQPTTFFPTTVSSLARAKKQRQPSRVIGKVNAAILYPANFPNCTSDDTAVFPPWCLKQIYNVGNYTPLEDQRNRVGM